ncbi:MAG TPA: hypothetical protein VG965_03805 [Patescibacteria group bacterium]|nr:hypothetical protein [Patescibacteria group bacterium]
MIPPPKESLIVRESDPSLSTPFYNPDISYEDNFEQGPFGEFANGKKYEYAGVPTHKFLGKTLHGVFGISAGPLLNANYVMAALDHGYPIAVYKTVRSVPWASQGMPNIKALEIDPKDFSLDRAVEGIETSNRYKSPLTATNSFGVPSTHPDEWQPDMKKAVDYAKEGQMVIGSFQGTTRPGASFDEYVEDWQNTADLVIETGARVIEANLSCPNQGKEGIVCLDIDASEMIVRAIRERIGDKVKFGIKMTNFGLVPGKPDALRDFVARIGPYVDYVAAINTIPTRTLNPDGSPAFGPDRTSTGACGSEIKPYALSMVQRCAEYRDELGLDFSIIGIGGVDHPSDYTEFRLAGADAVMGATGPIFKPSLGREVHMYYPNAEDETNYLAQLRSNGYVQEDVYLS